MTQTSLLHCHDVPVSVGAAHPAARHERLTGVAAEVMDTPNVQLHHNKLSPSNRRKRDLPFPCTRISLSFRTIRTRRSRPSSILPTTRPWKKVVCAWFPAATNRAIPHIQEGGWHLPADQYPIRVVGCARQRQAMCSSSADPTIHGPHGREQ